MSGGPDPRRATWAQKREAGFRERAAGLLSGSKQDFLLNPNWLASLPIVSRILNNPDVFDANWIANNKANNSLDANTAYEGATARTNERAAQLGTFRGGDTRLAERLHAVDLADRIATGNRNIEIRATEGNRASEIGAANLGAQFAQIPFTLDEAIARAYLGGNLPGSPSFGGDGFGQAAGGIGQGLGALFASGLFKSNTTTAPAAGSTAGSAAEGAGASGEAGGAATGATAAGSATGGGGS